MGAGATAPMEHWCRQGGTGGTSVSLRALAEGRLVVTVDPASTVRLVSAARSSFPSVVAALAVAIADSAAAGT